MKGKHEPEKQFKENHIYLSSNIPCETAQRHNGCNGFEKKKKKIQLNCKLA